MFYYLHILTQADENMLLLVKEKLFMTGILKTTSKYLSIPTEECNMGHPLSKEIKIVQGKRKLYLKRSYILHFLHITEAY